MELPSFLVYGSPGLNKVLPGTTRVSCTVFNIDKTENDEI